jgi:hypothetical protein
MKGVPVAKDAGDNAEDLRVAGLGRRLNLPPIETAPVEEVTEKPRKGSDGRKVSGNSDADAGAQAADKARGNKW